MTKTPKPERPAFAVQKEIQKAETSLEGDGEPIRLSFADWNQFIDVSENPPEPNNKLKTAARRYAKLGGQLVA